MNRSRTLGLAALLAAACAVPAPGAAQESTAPPGGSVQQQGSAATGSRREPRRRRDVISRQELEESGTTNLFDAVYRLRPQWLRGRGATNLNGGGTAVVVYQNHAQLGGVDVLRTLNPEFAEELRFLDAATASNTLPGLGSRSVAGAIVIIRPGTAR